MVGNSMCPIVRLRLFECPAFSGKSGYNRGAFESKKFHTTLILLGFRNRLSGTVVAFCGF